jgi:hypothetical protein
MTKTLISLVLLLLLYAPYRAAAAEPDGSIGYPSRAFDYSTDEGVVVPKRANQPAHNDVIDPVEHNPDGVDSDPTFVREVTACLAELERANPTSVGYYIGPRDHLVHINAGAIAGWFWIKRCMAVTYGVQM